MKQKNKIVGYTAGVFDMFHIGHLNRIKGAKELCDYLIVGVNSDELVETYKSKKPVINQNDRMEIVKAIKYVDEVVLIETRDKKDAYDKYKFDILIAGEEWKNTESYIKAEEDFKNLGVKVCYKPYTERVSSTMLRNIILENK